MRRTILLLATAALVLLLVGGVALAANIDCAQVGNPCTGTSKADQITASFSDDEIIALGGNDTVSGGPTYGNDLIYGGSGDDVLHEGVGNDSVYGQGGNDQISVEADSNILSGGAGNDTIDAVSSDNFTPKGSDRVDGGRGNDTIDAVDDAYDTITCGAGSRDRVSYDLDLDSVDGTCETEVRF